MSVVTHSALTYFLSKLELRYALKNHSHSADDFNIPTELPNPKKLTVQIGSSTSTWDGSANLSKTVNCSTVGASPTNHTHKSLNWFEFWKVGGSGKKTISANMDYNECGLLLNGDSADCNEFVFLFRVPSIGVYDTYLTPIDKVQGRDNKWGYMFQIDNKNGYDISFEIFKYNSKLYYNLTIKCDSTASNFTFVGFGYCRE